MNKNTNTALIVVDIQNDFVSGSLATDPEREYVKKTAAWLTKAKDSYDYIVTTQDWHIDPADHFDNWPVHCQADTIGAELSEHISLALHGADYARFLKGQYSDGYSGFDGTLADDDETVLKDWLRERNVDTVDIIGIATDHCVRATAVDAVGFGFETSVLRNYVNGVSKSASEELLNNGFLEAGIRVR